MSRSQNGKLDSEVRAGTVRPLIWPLAVEGHILAGADSLPVE